MNNIVWQKSSDGNLIVTDWFTLLKCQCMCVGLRLTSIYLYVAKSQQMKIYVKSNLGFFFIFRYRCMKILRMTSIESKTPDFTRDFTVGIVALKDSK